MMYQKGKIRGLLSILLTMMIASILFLESFAMPVGLNLATDKNREGTDSHISVEILDPSGSTVSESRFYVKARVTDTQAGCTIAKVTASILGQYTTDLQKNSEGDYEGWVSIMGIGTLQIDAYDALGNIGAVRKTIIEGNHSTATPTTQSSSTAVPTPNPESGIFKITGAIAPDFSYLPAVEALIKSGFKITLEAIGQDTKTKITMETVIDQAGCFSFEKVPCYDETSSDPNTALTYTLKISKPGYLMREFNLGQCTADVELGSIGQPKAVWAGDVTIEGYQDNVINMLDVMTIAKGFNAMKDQVGYNAETDFNLDNVVNMGDIMIAVRHFNKASKDIY